MLCEIVLKHDMGMRLCESPDSCSGHGTMTSPWVVVLERSQIYRMWAYPWVVSPSNLSLYGMWAYPWVVSPSNLSLFWDDRLVPG